MANLKALETYFNDSIFLAKKNNPWALPVIRELKTISLDHAAGYLSETHAKQKMHNALARHGHNPSLVDDCFFEAKNIKAANFDSREFLPSSSKNPKKPLSENSNPWGSMFLALGNRVIKKPSAINKPKKPMLNAFTMPNFEGGNRVVKSNPKNTSFKMAEFGKGFIIQPFNSGAKKPSNKNNFNFNFSMPNFEKKGGRN